MKRMLITVLAACMATAMCCGFVSFASESDITLEEILELPDNVPAEALDDLNEALEGVCTVETVTEGNHMTMLFHFLIDPKDREIEKKYMDSIVQEAQTRFRKYAIFTV